MLGSEADGSRVSMSEFRYSYYNMHRRGIPSHRSDHNHSPGLTIVNVFLNYTHRHQIL